MFFSEAYKIENPEKEDWFNLWLENDTKIYIDPMLVYQANHEDFSESYEKIGKFFEEAFRRVALAKSSKSPKIREKALEMLQFKEPSELHLGHTNYGSSGAGIGPDFARQIFDAIVDFIELGFEEFGEYISPLEIFVDGIGADRISDMMGNLMKEDLIKYTQKICKEKKINLKKFKVRNFSFDKNLGWTNKPVELPENPLYHTPIILVPKDFLRTNSYLDRDDFLEYILNMENATLRTQASRLFTQDLNKTQLIQIIKANPSLTKQLFKEYLEQRKKEPAPHYDFSNDPNSINEIPLLIRQIVGLIDTRFELKERSEESLKEFVEKVIHEFKLHAEANEGYKLLFNDDGSPRGEKIVQNLFHAIARGFCCEKKVVDITPESATGKGPVDFKFSEGYSKKIVVEIKLAKNPQLVHGLEKQLPAYMKSSDIDLGYYLVIKQMKDEKFKISNIKYKHENLKLEEGRKISLEIVDVSKENMVSASKIK